MRLGWVFLVMPQLAAADPPPAPSHTEPKVIVVPDPPNRLPGATPGTGIIIAPPKHFPDGRDYPLGMVIRPNFDSDDAFVISPGAIADGARRFGRRLQDAFGVVGKLFEQH